MKKFLCVLLALSMLMLAGCACEHEWVDADCVTSKACKLCKETQGEPLGHTWVDATCEAPKTCTSCGLTEGEALGHAWVEATCESAKTCSVCAATEGAALGHTWVDATYEAPKTCSVCAATEGEHLVRVDLDNTKEEMEAGLGVTMQLMGYNMVFVGNDEDGWPNYALADTAGNYSGVSLAFEPTQDGAKVLSVLIATEDVNNPTAGSLLGATASATLLGIEPDFDIDAFTQMLQGQPETMADGGLLYQMVDSGIAVEMKLYSNLAVIQIYPAK